MSSIGRPEATMHLRFDGGRLQQWFVQVGYNWVSPWLQPMQGAVDPNSVGEWRDVPTTANPEGK